jgi:hypothetical protein
MSSSAVKTDLYFHEPSQENILSVELDQKAELNPHDLLTLSHSDIINGCESTTLRIQPKSLVFQILFGD